MVSVFVCQAGRPGSCPARSSCFRKVEFYQCATELLPPVLTTGSTKAVHALSCLCDNVCKRSLLVRVGHLVLLTGFCLSLCGLHVLNRDVNMIQNQYISIHLPLLIRSLTTGLFRASIARWSGMFWSLSGAFTYWNNDVMRRNVKNTSLVTSLETRPSRSCIITQFSWHPQFMSKVPKQSQSYKYMPDK